MIWGTFAISSVSRIVTVSRINSKLIEIKISLNSDHERSSGIRDLKKNLN